MELSPSGGLVSPSSGFASLLFDQVEYFASIKLLSKKSPGDPVPVLPGTRVAPTRAGLSWLSTEGPNSPFRNHWLDLWIVSANGRRIRVNQVVYYIFDIFFKNGWKTMLFKSVETFRDYTTKKSKLFLLLAFLSKVTAYRVKSHLNRVISYLSLSMKTSVVLCATALWSQFWCQK